MDDILLWFSYKSWVKKLYNSMRICLHASRFAQDNHQFLPVDVFLQVLSLLHYYLPLKMVIIYRTNAVKIRWRNVVYQ